MEPWNSDEYLAGWFLQQIDQYKAELNTPGDMCSQLARIDRVLDNWSKRVG